jgi:RNA-directed DNA polymerase
VDRYFGEFHPSRRDRWVFGDRYSGAFLIKFAWTGIVRHQLVKGGASLDDPALIEYWRDRRRRKAPPMDRRVFSWQSGSRGSVLSASRR